MLTHPLLPVKGKTSRSLSLSYPDPMPRLAPLGISCTFMTSSCPPEKSDELTTSRCEFCHSICACHHSDGGYGLPVRDASLASLSRCASWRSHFLRKYDWFELSVMKATRGLRSGCVKQLPALWLMTALIPSPSDSDAEGAVLGLFLRRPPPARFVCRRRPLESSLDEVGVEGGTYVESPS